MIYIDSSVALAQIFSEDRVPPVELWQRELCSSRLLEYELWNRVHARKLGRSHGELVRQLVSGVELSELSADILTRALEPFPVPVRTLDALHLASMDFLRGQGYAPELASYDARLNAAARALAIPLYAF